MATLEDTLAKIALRDERFIHSPSRVVRASSAAPKIALALGHEPNGALDETELEA